MLYALEVPYPRTRGEFLLISDAALKQSTSGKVLSNNRKKNHHHNNRIENFLLTGTKEIPGIPEKTGKRRKFLLCPGKSRSGQDRATSPLAPFVL